MIIRHSHCLPPPVKILIDVQWQWLAAAVAEVSVQCVWGEKASRLETSVSYQIALHIH